jgi:hypothetical protein
MPGPESYKDPATLYIYLQLSYNSSCALSSEVLGKGVEIKRKKKKQRKYLESRVKNWERKEKGRRTKKKEKKKKKKKRKKEKKKEKKKERKKKEKERKRCLLPTSSVGGWDEVVNSRHEIHPTHKTNNITRPVEFVTLIPKSPATSQYQNFSLSFKAVYSFSLSFPVPSFRQTFKHF